MTQAPPDSLPQLFAVLGDPIAHSRSPQMHAAALAALGVPHRYMALHVRDGELPEALRGVRALGLGGVNLTVPHKQPALEIVDSTTPAARRIGAINTVLVRQTEAGARQLIGDNTDSPGFARAVRELGPAPVERAMVLGSGGASRAIVDALLHELRCKRLVWVTRKPTKLLAQPHLQALDRAGVELVVTGYGQLANHGRFDLLVNTTTVGMHGGPVAFPVPVEPASLCPGGRVVDIVYPRPRGGLLERAQAVGCSVQDGLPMLLWQGVLALERWLGQPIEAQVVQAMRRAIENG